MLHLTQVIKTFPSVSIASMAGGLPVEVSLIAQLSHGSGDHLFTGIAKRQKAHASFIDELDEPSAKLGAPDFSKNDPSSLYTFLVGPNGHPWHRHAGHRIFTAISGSGGTQLRFSTASRQQIDADPESFIRALRFVNIPADCLFTVRFGGETWHQFAPLMPHSPHPAFFALSCHTNELGGDLPESVKQKVLAGDGDIPSLTELPPPAVMALLKDRAFEPGSVPVTTLSLDAPAGTLHRLVCDTVRHALGLFYGKWGAWRHNAGFLSNAGFIGAVEELHNLPEDSLLRAHLTDQPIHHEDAFRLPIAGITLEGQTASNLLALFLEGCLVNAPRTVSRLMALRNTLVKPLGLRTSPLGCPVSSLLSDTKDNLFAGKYPVFDQRIAQDDTRAEIILGADDKHLSFRSYIDVRIVDNRHAEITMGNRVHCKNRFGQFYIAAIDAVHRRYVTPTIMRTAADFAITQLN